MPPPCKAGAFISMLKYLKKGLRKCYWCKKVKPLNDFYRDKNHAAGYAYLCKTCNPEQKRRSRWKFRFELLKSSNFTCQYCGRKAPEIVLEIDHIYPKSIGGKNKKENYQILCRECNLGKGDSILQEFKK